MKKILAILIAIMLMTVSKSVFASDFTAVSPSGHTLQYTIINNNSVSVYSNGFPSGALVIPDSVTYKGYTFAVTSISDAAFENCSGLTSVTIGNSVTFIGSYAFSGCSGLTTPNTYW